MLGRMRVLYVACPWGLVLAFRIRRTIYSYARFRRSRQVRIPKRSGTRVWQNWLSDGRETRYMGHCPRRTLEPDDLHAGMGCACLFHQDEVETQIALMPIFPIIYRHEDVVLEASGPRLIFRPRFNSARSLEAAERMAVTVLDDLPNTPLIGVGINFSFVERNPPARCSNFSISATAGR